MFSYYLACFLFEDRVFSIAFDHENRTGFALRTSFAGLCALAASFTTSILLPETARAADAPGAAQPRAVLRVGPGRQLERPSAAALVAQNGDIVEIDAGSYDGDTAIWTHDNLTIRGVGGSAHMRAGGVLAEDKAIWIVKGSNTVIEHVEFSGAAVRFRNGAGIRQEGAGLTLRHCYFHHNENGILTNANPESDIVIENSEFAYNGHGDGYSHNMYIGGVRSFTLRFSYVHRAVVGHNVKSRARRSTIEYNRVTDADDGRSSYAIDLPNGGVAYVIGNILQQGPATENDAIVAYGAEGLRNPVNELYFVANTVVNDLPDKGRFLAVWGEPGRVAIMNNIFAGSGEVLSGPGELTNNLVAARSEFLDAAGADYRLIDGATAIGRAIDPGRASAVDLRPASEYVHPMAGRPRDDRGLRDIGALEYREER